MPRKKTIEDLGELQRAVVQAVWELGEATVQQVRDHLADRRPAYTTVLSVMQRLERLGWLTHRAEGRTYVYRAARSAEEERAGSLRSMLGRLFGGDPLLLFQHLVANERLTDKELAALREMIDREQKERGR